MNDENMAHIIKLEAARALPWGVMVLVVMLFAGMWLKQEIKEGIAFASQTVIQDVRTAVLEPRTFVPMKRKVKEAIQYAAHTAIQQAKDAVLQPQTFVPMKRKVKEAIQYTAKTAADQYERVESDMRRHR